MDVNMLSFSFEELSNITGGKWHNLPPQNLSNISCVNTDTRENIPNSMFIALKGDNFDAHDFLDEAIQNGAQALCVEEKKYNESPSKISIPILKVKNSLLALQEIARHHRQKLHGLTLIAITGSNGKTSTKEILSQILIQEYGEDKVYATKANTNNYIGVPLNLLKLTDKHKFAVIELGTNHPGEIDLLASITVPDIAIITSLGPAHLEYFKNLDGVAYEKSSIFNYFQHGSNKNLAIVPENTLKYEPIREALFKKKYLTFSGNSTTSFITYTPVSASIKSSTFELVWNNMGIKQTSTWSILGNHQLENASAAAVAATHIGIKPENIAKHLQKCSLTGMRMKIREVNGITIINDAYNANPASTTAGIKWLKSILVRPLKNNYFIVLGDMFELGDDAVNAHVDILNLALDKLNGCHIVTIGSIMKEALHHIEKEKKLNNKNIINLPDSEKGASYITERAKPGDVIYLKGSRRNRLERIDESLK